MKKSLATIAAIAALSMLSGCKSTSTITEFDPTTGIKTKVTETSESVVDQIIASTKDKAVFAFDKGWIAGLEATLFSSDNPVPITRAIVMRKNKGVLTIPKEMQNINTLADIINACVAAEAVSAGSSGISGGDSDAN